MAVHTPALTGFLNEVNLDQIKERHGAPPWAEAVVVSDEMQAFVIHQPPGHLNDTHYHHHDEWWVVLEGEIAWHIEGREDRPVVGRAGSFVYCPAFHWHHLVIRGDKPATRVGIGARGEFHRYDRPGCGPAGSAEQWRPGA
jgi:mannose-6-phosphate isomerase-like protein (cupin superfamily)